MSAQPQQLITREEVARLLCISVSTLKRIEKTDAAFPRPTLCGLRRLGYFASDVCKFQRVQQQRAKTRKAFIPDPASGAAAARRARAAKAEAAKPAAPTAKRARAAAIA